MKAQGKYYLTFFPHGSKICPLEFFINLIDLSTTNLISNNFRDLKEKHLKAFSITLKIRKQNVYKESWAT